MNPRPAFRRLNWKWSLPGLILVALLAAFFNPPNPGVTSGEFEYVQRVVDGDTLVLGTGERVRLIGVNTPETKRPNTPVEYFGREATEFTRRLVEGKPGGGVIRHLLKRLQLAERLKQHSASLSRGGCPRLPALVDLRERRGAARWPAHPGTRE